MYTHATQCKVKYVSIYIPTYFEKNEYAEELSQSQITDQPMAPWGRLIRTQTDKDTYTKSRLQIEDLTRVIIPYEIH